MMTPTSVAHRVTAIAHSFHKRFTAALKDLWTPVTVRTAVVGGAVAILVALINSATTVTTDHQGQCPPPIVIQYPSTEPA